jgi:hypothetical protein
MRNPQRLYARQVDLGLKIKSDLHGDMQRPVEISGPHGDVEQQE